MAGFIWFVVSVADSSTASRSSKKESFRFGTSFEVLLSMDASCLAIT